MAENLVIIPTYNEIENIDEMVRTVVNLPVGFDLLIVDDGSPDGTGDRVKELQNTYSNRLHLLSRKGKLGLGTAYIAGFKYALERDYKFVYEMDCDFSHDPNDLVNLHEACVENGADLVIGSRYVSGVNVVNWPMGRVLMSYFASVYVRFITGMPVHDATAGFKCYRRGVLESIDLDKIRFKGYAFQIEMKFTAWWMGFHVMEVPIIFRDRTLGNSKMSSGIFKEAFFGVIGMKLRSLFKKRPARK